MPIYRGTYYSKMLRFKRRSNGQLIDISTWQFAASLRDETGAEVLSMSTANGHFTVLTDGALLCAIPPEETSDLPRGRVSFALYRTDDGNGEIRILRAVDYVRNKD